MPLDIWFPLAIYHADLNDAVEHAPGLQARIDALLSSAEPRRTSETTSWTGDVHGVDRLHLDPAFDWLTAQIGHHIFEYLSQLGHDLEKIDVHIQRSWPVVAERGQSVARHAHHSAHLSAVYYVAAPGGNSAGRTRFFNDHRANELSGGLGSDMTQGYARHNAFNFGSASYTPAAGRLLLFPAKQTHSVEPHECDERRISVSYDVVLTARADAPAGHHEFLMPSPTTWRRIAAPSPKQPEPLSPAADRYSLSDVATHGRPIDNFSIPEMAGHILWDTLVFPHVSSGAAWGEYRAALLENAGDGWARDRSQTFECWDGCGAWHGWRDAVDRITLHLEQHGIALDGAKLSKPVLQRRTAREIPPFDRGSGHLCIYLRIDHDPTECALDFAEGGTINLPSGHLLVASGIRRQRLRGECHVIFFELDLPAEARLEALNWPAFRRDDVHDHIVFAALTARPLTHILPSPDLLFEKIRWLDARNRRRERQHSCPAVIRFLIERVEPALATAHEIEMIRAHGLGGDNADNGQLVIKPDVLTPTQCANLRAFADAHMTAVVPDSVDDFPEYQVNLDKTQLAALIGDDTCSILFDLGALLADQDAAGESSPLVPQHIFVRMYSTDTRPFIAFHADTCHSTVNVSLSDDAATSGGQLLVLAGDELRRIARSEGTAAAHAGNLVHGVTRIDGGTRYTLIIFFDRPAPITVAD